MFNYYPLLRPFIFCMDEERAHHLALFALRHGLLPKQPETADARLKVDVFGLNFKNPLGMAAGFDKNAAALNGLAAQGFGFVEAGTVTPKPQPGNPQKRLFRLKEDEAIINRMGFNNAGMEPFGKHLDAWRTQPARNVVVGGNIGKNKDTTNAVADYVTLLQAFYGRADYLTVNISSPNTPGLRALQKREALDELLGAIAQAARAEAAKHGSKTPVLLKIAPDISGEEAEAIAEVTLAHELDGLIISNTTIGARDALKCRKYANETGGLSGAPLFEASTELLARMYALTNGKLPLVGAGGIASGADAWRKLEAGATLIQVYSALIYKGFSLVPQILSHLTAEMNRQGITHIGQVTGKNARK